MQTKNPTNWNQKPSKVIYDLAREQYWNIHGTYPKEGWELNSDYWITALLLFLDHLHEERKL